MNAMKREINRNQLMYHTGRRITCPRCESILDYRRSVEVTVLVSGKVAACMLTCVRCYDAANSGTITLIDRLARKLLNDGTGLRLSDVSFEILDGREYA